jgi:hypothetical protein
MTPWLVHKLRNLGLEVICLDARASSLLMESLADSSGAKFLIPFRRCFDGGTVMGRAYSQDLRKRQFSPSPKRPFATLLHERLMHSSKPSLKRSQTSHPASAHAFARRYQGVFDPTNEAGELAKLIKAATGVWDREVVLIDEPFVGLRAMDES